MDDTEFGLYGRIISLRGRGVVLAYCPCDSVYCSRPEEHRRYGGCEVYDLSSQAAEVVDIFSKDVEGFLNLHRQLSMLTPDSSARMYVDYFVSFYPDLVRLFSDRAISELPDYPILLGSNWPCKKEVSDEIYRKERLRRDLTQE